MGQGNSEIASANIRLWSAFWCQQFSFHIATNLLIYWHRLSPFEKISVYQLVDGEQRTVNCDSVRMILNHATLCTHCLPNCRILAYISLSHIGCIAFNVFVNFLFLGYKIVKFSWILQTSIFLKVLKINSPNQVVSSNTFETSRLNPFHKFLAEERMCDVAIAVALWTYCRTFSSFLAKLQYFLPLRYYSVLQLTNKDWWRRKKCIVADFITKNGRLTKPSNMHSSFVSNCRSRWQKMNNFCTRSESSLI